MRSIFAEVPVFNVSSYRNNTYLVFFLLKTVGERSLKIIHNDLLNSLFTQTAIL